MNSLSALIVDDERLARRELRNLLTEHKHIKVVGEADSVDSAEIAVKTHQPDIVFLDIQLMGETGFDFINRFEKPNFRVIFSTAYDEYAIRAFDVNAVGYLLKPIDPKQLKATLERIDQSDSERERKPAQMQYNDMLFYKSNLGFNCFRLDTVRSIHADGDYSCFHTTDQKQHLILNTLKHWENCLPSEYFQRIHRSVIVNLQYISRIDNSSGSNMVVHLSGSDETCAVGRTYVPALRKIMTQTGH